MLSFLLSVLSCLLILTPSLVYTCTLETLVRTMATDPNTMIHVFCIPMFKATRLQLHMLDLRDLFPLHKQFQCRAASLHFSWRLALAPIKRTPVLSRTPATPPRLETKYNESPNPLFVNTMMWVNVLKPLPKDVPSGIAQLWMPMAMLAHIVRRPVPEASCAKTTLSVSHTKRSFTSSLLLWICLSICSHTFVYTESCTYFCSERVAGD